MSSLYDISPLGTPSADFDESKRLFTTCANCGCDLGETFILFQDNYLQVNYFDSNECNAFCSRECACESLMLAELPNTKAAFNGE